MIMETKHTEHIWDMFCAWVRNNGGIAAKSEAKYFPAFREQFDRLYSEDLRSLYLAYVDYTSRSDPNRYVRALFPHYLRYRLEAVGAISDISPINMTLLKELFEAGENHTILLDLLLKHLTGMKPVFDFRSIVKSSFQTSKGKMTAESLYYFSLRSVLLGQWDDPCCRPALIDGAEQFLRSNCPSVYPFRRKIAAMALALHKRWQNQAGFEGSGTQQTLLQLASLDLPKSISEDTSEYIDFFYDADIYTYAGRLLLALVTDLLRHHGTTFGPATLTADESSTYWLWLLVLAPFQRMHSLSADFFTKTTSAGVSYTSPHILKLVMNGLLWLTAPSNAHSPQIRLIPCAYRFLIGKGTTRPTQLWVLPKTNSNIAAEMAQLRQLLRQFCTRAAALQANARQLIKNADQLHRLDICQPAPELSLILSCAPDPEGTHRSTITPLLSVQAGCCWAQICSNDADLIISGTTNLRALFSKWAHILQELVQPDKLDFLRLPYEHKAMDTMLLRHQTERLLQELSSPTEGTDPRILYKFAVFAEQGARDSLHAAHKEGNCYEQIRCAQAQIHAVSLQAKYSEPKEDPHASGLTDYLLPCWKLLHRCAQELERYRAGVDFKIATTSNPTHIAYYEDRVSQTTEAFRDAAAFYNNAFPGFAEIATHEEQELLHFDCKKTPEQLQRQYAALSTYVAKITGNLKNNIFPYTVPGGPEIMIPTQNNYRKFHQNWYLSNMDSVFAAKGENAEYAKRQLMTHILSAQNAVLTINQFMDNKTIQQLAHNPGFLWMVKTGRIGISLYGNLYSLVDHAARQMEMTYQAKGQSAFQWSSLSSDFDWNETARKEAAQYLRGKRSPNSLADAFRDDIVRFAENMRILDEALTYDTRNRHFQRAAQPNMITQMNVNYNWLKHQGTEPDVCLIHDKICAALGDRTFRSDYRQLLELCRREDAGNLTAEQEDLLETISCLQHKDAVLNKVEFLLDDQYNRMLANTFTTLADFSYTRDQRQLLRFDETKPITDGGCKLYYQSHTLTDTGCTINWSDLVDRAIAQDDIISKYPGLQPEDMVRILNDDAVDYNIQEDMDGRMLRVGRVALRTDEHQECPVLVEMTDNSDMVHMETGKERKHES